MELTLIGRQQELVERVLATGTPVVLLVVSGRPLVLEPFRGRCAAILLAWVPGDAGADAIADVLVGDENPSGKLPMAMPRSVGQVPLNYRHHPSGGRSNPRGDYVDGPAGPSWPFGFGRSYTTFTVDGFELDRTSIPTADGEVRATVTVTNTGSRAGDEIVQLYARDEEASVGRPLIELAGFKRVTVGPGEICRVTFTLSAEQFAYTNAGYRRVVEPGDITPRGGTSSPDLPLSAPPELTGPGGEGRGRARVGRKTEGSQPSPPPPPTP